MKQTPPKKSGKVFKVAWIRNDVPAGTPAPGRLNCPCRQAPESRYDPSNGDVYCQCGRRYTWDGCVKGISAANPTLTAYTVHLADGSEYTTSMSEETTLIEAYKYFHGHRVEGKEVVDVAPYFPNLK